jgi:hypothetical protein
VCVLVLKLPDHPLAITVINFGQEEASEDIDLGDPKNAVGPWVDIMSGKPSGLAGVGRVADRVSVLTGTTLVPSKGQ